MINKKRREELKWLFRTHPQLPRSDDFPQVLPWEIWLLLNVPEYQTSQNGKALHRRLENQFRAVMGIVRAIPGMPELRSIDWNLLLTGFRTPGFWKKEPKLRAFFEELFTNNRVFAFGFVLADKILNYAYTTAQKCSPKGDIEEAYVFGLIESDGHVWKEVYKEGKEKERLKGDDLAKELSRLHDNAAKQAIRKLQDLGLEGDPRLIPIYFLNHEGKSQREIAEILEVSAGTVNRLIKKIEDILGRHFVLKHKGGAGKHVGNKYRRNRTQMDITHHNPD